MVASRSICCSFGFLLFFLSTARVVVCGGSDSEGEADCGMVCLR